MYTVHNFKTKKALKEAVALRQRWLSATALPLEAAAHQATFLAPEPDRVTFFQPNDMFGSTPTENGNVVIEGPHGVHKWYAQCTIVDGEMVKVK